MEDQVQYSRIRNSVYVCIKLAIHCVAGNLKSQMPNKIETDGRQRLVYFYSTKTRKKSLERSKSTRIPLYTNKIKVKFKILLQKTILFQLTFSDCNIFQYQQ